MLVFILNAGSSSLKYQLMNPKTAEVSKPFELILGFFANAKYAL